MVTVLKLQAHPTQSQISGGLKETQFWITASSTLQSAVAADWIRPFITRADLNAAKMARRRRLELVTFNTQSDRNFTAWNIAALCK